MTSPTDDPGRLFSKEQGDVVARVDGLRRAVDAARGRLNDEAVNDAAQIVDRADERLRLSGEHTIVALAGATGSGKSTLFNQLAELDLAGVGVRRPTTSWALACAWGPEGAAEILEWVGIPPRHQVSRMSMLDGTRDDTNLHGLVLLDLPDHDSTEVSHHLEVDRLVTHADLFVWVLDPQKYADAAVHERYLRPLATHGDVTIVVLNQIDTIPASQRDTALADVRRLLVEDGLADVLLLGVSAAHGEGVDELRRVLVKRIRDKAAAKERLGADVGTAAGRFAEVSGTTPAPGVGEDEQRELDDRLAGCAGVPVVVDAIERSTSRRAARTTGWPVTRWLARLRVDPLRHLGSESDLSVGALARPSVPEPTKVQRASVDTAVRELVGRATSGMCDPWARAVRSASEPHAGSVADALDEAVVGTDLHASGTPLWWRMVWILQWLLIGCAVVGLGWLLVLAGMSLSQAFSPVVPQLLGVPLPTVLLVGGIVLGVVLAVVCRFAARASGRRKAERADRALRKAISDVAYARVVGPMRAEVKAYEECRSGLLAALGSQR